MPLRLTPRRRSTRILRCHLASVRTPSSRRAQVFQDSQDQWYDWYGAGTTFDRWIHSTIAFDLSDGALVPEYAFFSPLLGFSPNATLRTYFLLVLNDISHRLEGESLAPIICGCGPL